MVGSISNQITSQSYILQFTGKFCTLCKRATRQETKKIKRRKDLREKEESGELPWNILKPFLSKSIPDI